MVILHILCLMGSFSDKDGAHVYMIVEKLREKEI